MKYRGKRYDIKIICSNKKRKCDYSGEKGKTTSRYVQLPYSPDMEASYIHVDNYTDFVESIGDKVEVVYNHNHNCSIECSSNGFICLGCNNIVKDEIVLKKEDNHIIGIHNDCYNRVLEVLEKMKNKIEE
jgi:hypothetical protein